MAKLGVFKVAMCYNWCVANELNPSLKFHQSYNEQWTSIDYEILHHVSMNNHWSWDCALCVKILMTMNQMVSMETMMKIQTCNLNKNVSKHWLD